VTGFGVALPPSGRISELASLANSIEQLDCDWLWINEDRLQRDSFTVLAALANSTRSIRLGPGVTNPFTRHPALIASAIATLDELSGGRAVLGLGAGGTNHRMLGLERRAPASALRDAVTVIRGLIAGDCVTVRGGTVRARDAELDFEPVRDRVPLYIGARGPKILELAGEVADGVIVGNVATATGWRYALARIAAGAQRAGRGRSELERIAWLYTAIDEDSDAARAAVRHMVATTLVTSRPILDQLGVELPPRFAEEMERAEWRLSSSVIGPASALVPDELIGKFALAGTAAECREALSALLEAVPEITGIVIVPFATRTSSRAQVVERFMTSVRERQVERVGT
jgi:5,10-methylenetetrahydromethanopterin reductase